ncbi:DUF4112 domain-containing protein [Rivularia sp. UHCC 0363]|uniref:DUF4112 domain-containing protein n=1 Tax=Rivularia sp. UHCC 0363 TaxID=3110244 RepID=UPI002B210940|nr:DUF4112 domain-containing protein [Rivularia sp. UHCC 0363]MEA5595090.1 DUF4112 domain-containing protein [Rivularia sp. UHCC 0363]
MSLPPSQFYSLDPDVKAPTLKRLRTLSRILDKAITIPGTGIGVGLDPILGLIPAGGDFLGVLLSAYIILESARLGASKATLGRMTVNIILDALIGVVPVIGDFFDFAWKANVHNINLLEEHLKFPSQKKRADTWFVFVLLGVLLLLAIGLVTFSVVITRFIWGLFTGS